MVGTNSRKAELKNVMGLIRRPGLRALGWNGSRERRRCYVIWHQVHLSLCGCFASIALISAAMGSLEPSKLTDLIADSDVIVHAVTVEAKLRPPERGQAVLEVKRIYKGVVDSRTITIKWEWEAHDQKILEVGQDRLLFLTRRSDGSLTGTHYGRSYWPLYEDWSTKKLVAPYSWPTDYVDTGSNGLVKPADIWIREFPSDRNPVRVIAVFVEDIEAKIKATGRSEHLP